MGLKDTKKNCDSLISAENSYENTAQQTSFLSPSTQKKAKEKPHYSGHRERLRKKFSENGSDALHDYEILEIILFSAIPRRDVKPLAKTLLNTFGSLSGVINARIEELVKISGISETTAVLIKATKALYDRAAKNDLIGRPVLNNWTRLIDYCQTTIGDETREHFRVLFLNKKNELIADEVQGSGTVDHTPAYPREIMKRALEVGATALILLHNHPSGDARPSQADIDVTRLIVNAGEPFNIHIHDHIIIARGSYASMRNLGLI